MGLGSGFGYGGSTIDRTNYNSGNSRNDTANNSYSKSNRSGSSNRYSSNTPTSTNNVFSHKGESGSSNRYSSNTPTLNYANDKQNILENAPSKSITESYKIAENPNPFIRDVMSIGQKYNTYQRQVANPEYNNYIQNQNQKQTNRYNNISNKYRGAIDWSLLRMSNFQNESTLSSIFGNTGNNFMNNSTSLSLAKRALFG
jgi:hypothetical protein